MTRFIRNPAGAIHSVVDAFDLAAHKAVDEAWEEVTENVAKAEHAHLFGEPDPAVEAVRAHDGAGNPVEFTVTGNPVSTASPAVEDIASTAPTGVPDERAIEPEPASTKTAKSDGKHAAEVTA